MADPSPDALLKSVWSSFGRHLEGCERSLAGYVCEVARLLTVGPERASSSGAGLGPLSHEDLVLLTADLLFLYWLDDRFERLARQSMFTAIDELALGSRRRFVLGSAAWDRLGAMYAERFAERPDDLAYWTETADAFYDAYRSEALVDAGRVEEPSYSGYLRVGGVSTAWCHVLATLGLFYGRGLGRSRGEARFERAVSDAGVAIRLQNDLASHRKEVEEGTRANALIVLGRSLEPVAARAFVERERQTYEAFVVELTDSRSAQVRFVAASYAVLIAAVRILQMSRAHRYGLVEE